MPLGQQLRAHAPYLFQKNPAAALCWHAAVLLPLNLPPLWHALEVPAAAARLIKSAGDFVCGSATHPAAALPLPLDPTVPLRSTHYGWVNDERGRVEGVHEGSLVPIPIAPWRCLRRFLVGDRVVQPPWAPPALSMPRQTPSIEHASMRAKGSGLGSHTVADTVVVRP
jgi:hypothetical protein